MQDHQVSSLFGLPPRLSLGRDSLPRFLQAYDHPGYPAAEVLVYGTQVENSALQPGQAAFAEAWNREYAYPRLRYAGFAEALSNIVAQAGELSVVRGDGGPYWEDGLAANARVTAIARENSRRLPAAEKLATVAALANPRFVPDHAALAAAWRHSLLVDEHTWHADCSVRDPDSEQARRQGAAKDAHAHDARRELERVLHRAFSALGDVLPAGPGTLVLFNPSSWPRGGLLEVETGRGQGLVDPASGAPVPFEILRSDPVYQRVRLLAPEVPGLGYRCLTLRPLATPPRARAVADPAVLENEFYRATPDPARGGLRSLVDKETGREWVAPDAAFVLGQLLYVTGGDELPNRLVQYSTVSPIPALTVHAATNGTWRGTEVSAVGARVLLAGSTVNFPSVETEILLPAGRREVHLTVRARKLATRAKEAAYVAFPFAAAEPRFRYATQNGHVDPARDLLPGAGREWFSVQDWVSVSDTVGAATLAPLDAPLMTLGDIVRGAWPAEFAARPATVFSYVMGNYTPEGYAAEQGGEFTFRYVLTTARGFDAAESARFGAAALTPLEAGEITRADKLGATDSPLDAVQGRWLGVEPPDVQVTAWKPADDGRGTVVRLLETAGRPQAAVLELPAGFARVTRCTAVEDDLEPVTVREGRVRVALPPFGIATVRLEKP